MNKITVKNKLINLEAQIGVLKRAVMQAPDFGIDDSNWKKIKPTAKKIRAALYKKTYG